MCQSHISHKHASCMTKWGAQSPFLCKDGIWNHYNLKSTGRIYTFGVLKCSEKFKVLDLP